jgi:4-amino-4-deoxy-L-arabinose transferase-like glycosyltransferase
MSISKHLRSVWILILIALFGFFIRLYHVDTNPAGFFCDEAATGYNAFTILTSGKDEYGVSFPALFRSFDNYRPGLPIYTTIPFVYALGLNELSVRLPSVIIGTITLILIYYVTFFLSQSLSTARWAAFFLAISPWHIQFSRYAEGDIYIPFGLTLGTFWFLMAIQKKRPWMYVLSCISFGISAYSYFPAFIIMPLCFGMLLCIYFAEIRKHPKAIAAGIAAFICIYIPLLLGIVNKTTTARFTQISRSTQNKTINELVRGVLSTYKDHFSISFLFQNGDIGYKTHSINRFSVRGMGELYWFQLPLLLYGFWILYRSKKPFMFCIAWLAILYPLGSSIAPFADGGGPFATRSIAGVIPFQIISAYGMAALIQITRQRYKYIIYVCSLFIILFSTITYLLKYHQEYPLYSQDFWGWQFGPRDIMQTFLANKNRYDEYLIIGDFNAPEIFIKFYDPTNQCGSRCRVGRISDINPQKRQLIALSPSASQQASNFLTLQKTIYYPNGQPAFYIETTR